MYLPGIDNEYDVFYGPDSPEKPIIISEISAQDDSLVPEQDVVADLNDLSSSTDDAPKYGLMENKRQFIVDSGAFYHMGSFGERKHVRLLETPLQLTTANGVIISERSLSGVSISV